MDSRSPSSLTRGRIDHWAENPTLKLAGRMGMIVTTLIVAPYIYWLTSTTVMIVTTLNGISIIQRQQQDQMNAVTSFQSRMIDTVATEAQARSTQDAQFGATILSLQQKASEIDHHLDNSDARINQLFMLIQRGGNSR